MRFRTVRSAMPFAGNALAYMRRLAIYKCTFIRARGIVDPLHLRVFSTYSDWYALHAVHLHRLRVKLLDAVVITLFHPRGLCVAIPSSLQLRSVSFSTPAARSRTTVCIQYPPLCPPSSCEARVFHRRVHSMSYTDTTVSTV